MVQRIDQIVTVRLTSPYTSRYRLTALTLVVVKAWEAADQVMLCGARGCVMDWLLLAIAKHGGAAKGPTHARLGIAMEN